MALEWLDRTVLRAPHLALCTTERQYLKTVQSLGVADPLAWIGDGAAASVHTFNNSRGETTCVVTIPVVAGRSIELVASLLAHEAMHVVQELFDSIGEKNPGREIEAYAIQNVLYELLKSYKKQSKRK